MRVTAGDLVEVDEIRSGGSYLSQSDVRLHFGLGAHAMVDSIEITWPSGQRERIRNLAADKFYCVLEGRGVVAREKIVPAAVKR